MKHIGEDFQGWSVDAMTLEEILKRLGFKENKNSWTISKKNPILKAYPRLLEDDGMGYGIKPEFITEADKDTYETNLYYFEYENANEKDPFAVKRVQKKDKVSVFNLFREPEHYRPKDSDEEDDE